MKKLLSIALVLLAQNATSSDFWERDVWRDPERPFLFYGTEKPAAKPEKREEQAHAEQPKTDPSEEPSPVKGFSEPIAGGDRDLATIRTLTELKGEVQKRLERAVMDPSPGNTASYMQANAFLLAKSYAFSDAWRKTMAGYPEFDNTATHPAANFASTAIARNAIAKRDEELSAKAGDFGILLLIDNGELSKYALQSTERFAALYGFDLETVSVGETSKLLPKARVVTSEFALGISARGIRQYPAAVLLGKGIKTLREAVPVAHGVVGVSDMAERTLMAIRALELANKETQK